MAITILEAMKLPTFKDFDLVAGYRGLDRKFKGRLYLTMNMKVVYLISQSRLTLKKRTLL